MEIENDLADDLAWDDDKDNQALRGSADLDSTSPAAAQTPVSLIDGGLGLRSRLQEQHLPPTQALQMAEVLILSGASTFPFCHARQEKGCYGDGRRWPLPPDARPWIRRCSGWPNPTRDSVYTPNFFFWNEGICFVAWKQKKGAAFNG